MKDFWRVIKYASRSKFLFFTSVLLTIILTVIGLVIPFVFKLFFDIIQEVIKTNSFEGISQSLTLVALGYLGILSLETIFNSLKDYISSRWWYDAYNSVSLDVFKRLQILSMDFFDTHSIGKIRERTSQGINSLITIIDTSFRQITVQALFTAVAVIIVFRINTIFGLLAVISIPLLVYINLKNKRTFSLFRKENRKNWEAVGAFWQDSLSNARIVRAFTKEEAQVKKIGVLLDKIRISGLKINAKFAWIRIGRGFIIDSVRVFAITYGVYLIATNRLTLGTFTLLYSYLDRSLNPISQTTNYIEDIQQRLVDTNLLFEFLDENPTVIDSKNAISIKRASGDINFKNVSYRYDRRNVINNLNLEVKSGETVAFVGKSGVGKSTIMKLLLRFYDVTRGSISIDGHDIRNIAQKSLRENIATVFQDAYLFNQTIKYNIRYGNPKASKRKIEQAAELANADVFIKNLDKGLNTVIGERGVKLSGGEQQRISIARAIIKDAPIIILDEATSSLDSESELLIQNALYNLTKNKTTFIIAHRLSTVMRADKIIVLDKGRIAEIGTHRELIDKKGIYARLHEIQSGGYLA